MVVYSVEPVIYAIKVIETHLSTIIQGNCQAYSEKLKREMRMQEWKMPFFLCAVKESALPLLAMGKLYRVRYRNTKWVRLLYGGSVFLWLLLEEGVLESCPFAAAGYLLRGAEKLVILVLTVVFMEGCKQKNARLYVQAVLIRQGLEHISISCCVGVYGQAAARRLAETSGFFGGIGLAWAAVVLADKIKIDRFKNYVCLTGITLLSLAVKQAIADGMEISRIVEQAAGYTGGLALLFLLIFFVERKYRNLKVQRESLKLLERDSREYYGSLTEFRKNWEEQIIMGAYQKLFKYKFESTNVLKQLEEQAAYLDMVVCSGNRMADIVLHQKMRKAKQMGIMFRIQGIISRRSPLNGEEWLFFLEEMLEFGIKYTKPDNSDALWLLIEEQRGFEMLLLEITSKKSKGRPKLRELKTGKKITKKYQGCVQLIPGNTIKVRAMFQLKQNI